MIFENSPRERKRKTVIVKNFPFLALRPKSPLYLVPTVLSNDCIYSVGIIWLKNEISLDTKNSVHRSRIVSRDGVALGHSYGFGAGPLHVIGARMNFETVQLSSE